LTAFAKKTSMISKCNILIVVLVTLGLLSYVRYFQSKYNDLAISTKDSSQNQNRFSKYDYKFADDNCNESIYSFDLQSTKDTIFTDMELWRRCGINITINYKEAEPFNVPAIRTKCHIVNPILLSDRLVSRVIRPGFMVPNIVHYVLFGSGLFTFLNYISFKSANKFIRPQFIFVHGDGIQQGQWWNRTIEEIPNIYFIRRPHILTIQNRKPFSYAHQADIIRLQVLQGEWKIRLLLAEPPS
jgi:hypothetical protein